MHYVRIETNNNPKIDQKCLFINILIGFKQMFIVLLQHLKRRPLKQDTVNPNAAAKNIHDLFLLFTRQNTNVLK